MKNISITCVLLCSLAGLPSILHAQAQEQAEKTYEQAKSLWRQGKLDSAIAHCELLLVQSTQDDFHAKAYTLMAMAYRGKRHFTQSLNTYQKALDIAYRLNNSKYIARIHNNMGFAYQQIKEYSKARLNYNKTLSLNPGNKDRANVYNNLGIICKIEGDYDSALYYHRQALLLRPKDHRILTNLGSLYQVQGQYDSSFHYLYQSYEAKKKQLPSNHASIQLVKNLIAYNFILKKEYNWAKLILKQLHHTTTDSRERIQSYLLHGELFRVQGKFLEALEMYKIVDSLALVVSKEIDDRYHKQFADQIKGNVDEIAIQLSLKLKDLNTAFYFTERMKGNALLDITQTRQSLAYTPIISATEIQDRLSAKQALISHAIFADNLATFVISSDTILVHTQPKDSLEKVGQDFNFILEDYFADRAYIKNSHFLYQRLIAPIEEYIKDKPELLIIPEAKLFIPYEALLQDLPDTSQPSPLSWSYRDFPYMLKKHVIHYHFSASLAFMPRPERDYEKDYIGFAPSFGAEYTELPYSILEVQGVKEKWDIKGKASKAYVGDDASKDKIKQLKTQVLHIATHYHNGGLVMRDGSLTLKELQDASYNLETELVVLSGCQTFMGKFVPGEGPVNLVSHFIEAGAENVLFSFNKVYDGPGQRLIEAFFEAYLQEGFSYAEALQAAKIHMLEHKHYHHYVYWAGMGLISSEFAP